MARATGWRFSELSNRIFTALKRLDRGEVAFKNLRARVIVLEGQIDLAETAILNHRQRVIALEAAAIDHEARITALEGE